MNNPAKRKAKSGHKITIDDGDTITQNISRNIIIVDESKIHLALRDYDSDNISKALILTPIGIFISLGICIVTTDNFQDKFNISGHTWQAIIIIVMIMSVGWALWLLIKIFRSSPNKISTHQQFIERIKTET